jgi:aspartate kinase
MTASPRPLVVQKYGGTSLGDTALLSAVARHAVATRGAGADLVLVVSAMRHTTDELMERVREVTPDPDRRELDVLLATGEQTSMALMALAIRAAGWDAVSLTGAQCGIRTNPVHGNARILSIEPSRIRRELEAGRIVVAAGFQGADDGGEVTTLGRGGSDTTAVALAAALGADRCEIYTDVDGVFSADPRVVSAARCREVLASHEMLELAWHGAQVVKAEAVELAAGNGVPFAVGRSLGTPRTRVEPAYVPRQAAVSGVAGREDLLEVRLAADAPADETGAVLQSLAAYDLVFAGQSEGTALALLLSTLEMPDVGEVERVLEARFGDRVRLRHGLGAASLVGFGIGSRPGSLAAARAVLAELETPVLHAFSGRESFTFVLDATHVGEAVVRLHEALIEERPRAAHRPADAGAVYEEAHP